ncbi:MAG TPA: triose-phosphate isomerase [Actinomycetota bacterium]|nr:triose-phosphate isomerase [Actinomycetota bacterium]
MRKPVIAANWKMNKTHVEAILFVEALRNLVDAEHLDKVEVVICPPFTAIRSVQTAIDSDGLGFGLGAQDLHWEESGAYTGEVSAQMLRKLHVGYAIVGHSERRQHFGETNETVNKKVKAALAADVVPIVCVGESLEEREAGDTESKVKTQIAEGLEGIKGDRLEATIVAYEPIWAIGTGKNASPEDAQETIAAIRSAISSLDKKVAAKVRIQYGGSVKSSNIAELMAQPDIDGALVGGASLDAGEFAGICRFETESE